MLLNNCHAVPSEVANNFGEGRFKESAKTHKVADN